MTYKELGEHIAALPAADILRQAMVSAPDGNLLHVKALEMIREDVRLNPVVILTTEKAES